VPISIDTYKSNVARAAIAAGASLVNDVWGGRKDTLMYATVAEMEVPIVLMHNASATQSVHTDERLGSRFEGDASGDILVDVRSSLQELANDALAQGIRRENIILDPGFGFGKTVEQQLELVRRFGELTELGYPLLAGVSRKSFVGYTLDLPPEDRLEGTIAASVLCAERGANIIRVHDVRAIRRAIDFLDSVGS
jgi:dihydropteroate synthase